MSVLKKARTRSRLRSVHMPMDDPLRAAEEFLHREIPLTRAMGLRVVSHATGFAIEAPVASNRNHLHTAFGGSINSVATLAGYVFLWLRLRAHLPRIVIGHSAIRFVRPVAEMIRATCIVPGEEQLATFDAALNAKGKARLTQLVQIDDGGVLAAEFTGTFVAIVEAPAARSASESGM